MTILFSFVLQPIAFTLASLFTGGTILINSRSTLPSLKCIVLRFTNGAENSQMRKQCLIFILQAATFSSFPFHSSIFISLKNSKFRSYLNELWQNERFSVLCLKCKATLKKWSNRKSFPMWTVFQMELGWVGGLAICMEEQHPLLVKGL